MSCEEMACWREEDRGWRRGARCTLLRRRRRARGAGRAGRHASLGNRSHAQRVRLVTPERSETMRGRDLGRGLGE